MRRDCTDNIQTEARHYYYTPGWQVVEERVGTSTSADRQFVWGLRYIDGLVLRDPDTVENGALDERRYGLHDGNWNTIALASTSGTVTKRFNYDAYGVPTFLTDTGTVQTASATGWETLYAGYRWDGDPSRMYYVRNRFLLPYPGELNRRDPIGYIYSTNLYESTHSMPLIAIDPTGGVIVFTNENEAMTLIGEMSRTRIKTFHLQGDGGGNFYVGVNRIDPDGVFNFVNSRIGIPKIYSSLSSRPPDHTH